MRTRRFSATVVTFASCIALSGCGSAQDPIPDPVYLQCAWHEQGGEGTFRLLVDGVVDYENISERLADGSNSSGEGQLSGRGRWQLGDGQYLRDEAGHPQVTLEIPTEPGFGEYWSLDVVGVGGKIRLVSGLGESEEAVFLSEDCAQAVR